MNARVTTSSAAARVYAACGRKRRAIEGFLESFRSQYVMKSLRAAVWSVREARTRSGQGRRSEKGRTTAVGEVGESSGAEGSKYS